MALSTAHLAEFRTLLNRLSSEAEADLRRLLVSVDPSDGDAVREVLLGVWPEFVSDYGSASAALGAVLFEAMADDLSVAPVVALATAGDIDRAVARARWATTTAQPLGNLVTLLDELVKQPARDTIQDSSIRSGGAWARVPQGIRTCAFCEMLASRGAVYGSSRKASRRENGHKYHGKCDCAVVFVRGALDYPDGYDPDAMYERYHSAREGKYPSTKSILANMRRMYPEQYTDGVVDHTH